MSILIFDSFVKIAIFRAFLLVLGDLHHALRPELNTRSRQKRMTQTSQKKKKNPKNGFLKFHKNEIDGLKNLSTRTPLFYQFLHFKGCFYLNHKISFNLSVQVAVSLVFHNTFMMLFLILSSVLDK